jgi:uncharacterized protein (DUF486 family)
MPSSDTAEAAGVPPTVWSRPILLLTFSNIFMTFAWYGALEVRSPLAALESHSGVVGD